MLYGRHIGALLDEDHASIELQAERLRSKLVRALREPQEHELKLRLLLVAIDELSQLDIKLISLDWHIVIEARFKIKDVKFERFYFLLKCTHAHLNYLPHIVQDLNA